jgi:hypothetical protein
MLKVVNLRNYPRTSVRYIGRGSSLGNPFTNRDLASTKAYVQVDTVESAVGCYEAWLRGSPAWNATIPEAVRERARAALRILKGDELLGCYCTDSVKCHGQVVKKLWEEGAWRGWS